MEFIVKSLRCHILAAALLVVCGCRTPYIGDLCSLDKDLTMCDLGRMRPRTRIGSFASSTLGTTFLCSSELGRHSYRYNIVERNGIIYTCSGGHLDIAHLRNQADLTAHLAALTYFRLRAGAPAFTFELDEDTTCHVQVSYPSDWDDRDAAERAAVLYDVSAGLGKYFAFQAGIWHEIATWFGYKMTGIYSEFGSAFSWEDVYSNLVGCHIGYTALYDMTNPFDRAVTAALEAELEKLDGQARTVARQAADLVRGQWFKGEQPIVIMKGRNFDVGLVNGHVTPWLVPDVPMCPDAEPVPYAVPDLDFLEKYGFAVRFEMEPRIWEKRKILAVLYPNGEKHTRFEPDTQLHVLMEHIEQDAARRFGGDIAVLHTTESQKQGGDDSVN